jgi:hypothetical protein
VFFGVLAAIVAAGACVAGALLRMNEERMRNA